MYRSHVLVCGGTGCTSSGSETLISLLQEELKKNGLENEVAIVKTGCHGLCAQVLLWLFILMPTFYVNGETGRYSWRLSGEHTG